jgi:Domain of unknown function (DUF5667)
VIISRRAERFHELVEQGSTGGARLPEYADLLDVVGALRAVETPAPDPAFVATLRERLVAEAESVLAEAAAARDETDARLRLPPTTPRVQRRRRRLAAAVSGAVLVGTSAAVAVAAQGSLPGDGLYPVKRGLESAHAELTFDRAGRGRVLLDSAGTRLDEASQLSRERADPARVSEALDSFTQQATSGADLLVADYQATGDESSMTTLRTFTATSMARLEALQSVVPPAALDDVLQAARTLDQVQQVSVHTCASCTGPLATTVPSVLTQAAQAAADSWQVVVPPPRHHPSGPGATHGLPRLPHVPAHLPPASVTDPGQSTATDPDVPTDGEVQHTLHHLTDGLTDNQQNDVASTVTDTTNNLLDAVGQVGNQVAGTLDDTVGGVTSLLPSGLPSLP